MFEQKIRIVLCIILMVYHKKRAPIFGHNAKNLMLFKNSLDFSISIYSLLMNLSRRSMAALRFSSEYA